MRAKRVDRNQTEIVSKFRKYDVIVFHTHEVGKGFPDIVIGLDGVSVVGNSEVILKYLEGLENIIAIKGVNLLVEIKDGTLSPSQKKLTEPEEKWHKEWKGQVCIIESEEEIENLFKPLDKAKPL